MSSMLEQAILDAKELKEAAIKNAQQALIEKYSGEFEGEIEKLLEQVAVPPPAPPIPGAPVTPGAAPVDAEKAKSDSDSKSDMFSKLEYAYKDGEVIGNKVYTTGVVEVDLDSLSEFSFEQNKKDNEQKALQELKALSRKSKLNEELEEEMNDDDGFDDDSDSFPYDDEDEDMDDEDEDEDLEDDDDSGADELDDIHDFNDEGSFEDSEELDDEDDMDVDIEDEDFDDDEDTDEDDLYGTEDDVGFHIDYDSDKDEEDSDYNPDADVEDLDDEEDSDEDEDEEDYDDEESDEEEDDEEEYYSDEQDDEEDDSEQDDDEEELEENESSNEKALEKIEELIKQIESALGVVNEKEHPGFAERLKKMLKTAKGEKKQLEEAIKLDWKRSGPRSPWNGMFKEEQEHDYTLEQLQAQIEELEQDVESLKESNKKLKSGLKDSIKLNEGLVQKIKNYEQKLHESRILNYKLLYTNKALSDSSLNGQQKDKIAESISNAKTAEEVKLLYETLKSTMRDGSTRSTPKSLSEAVERRSSSILLRGTRAEPKKQDDIAERMKRLAGL